MLIDVNVSFGNWPFQKFLFDTPGKLERHLKKEGISMAFVSPIESVFYPDPDVYNKILFKKLKIFHSLIPIPVINPFLSNWKELLKEYVAYKKIKTIKILPNYHNYSLSSESVNKMMKELKERNISSIVHVHPQILTISTKYVIPSLPTDRNITAILFCHFFYSC